MTLALLSSALLAIGQPTTIVVDARPFESPQVAARAEERVDWLDDDDSDDNACTLCFAALELQRVLRMMTGRKDEVEVTMPEEASATGDRIHITIGGEGDPGSYRIESEDTPQGRVTRIIGADRVGALHGSYDLLHRLGVRWLAPGPLGEEMPRLPGGRIPLIEAQETPDFRLRGFHAWEDRGDEDFLLWMARNRMNYWCVAQTGHALMRKLGIMMAAGGHVIQSMYINPTDPYSYEPADDPYPPSPTPGGDADGDGVLTYAEAHPEWYGLIDGERTPDIRGDMGVNYCTSNPHATAELVKGLVDDLSDGHWRDADVVNAWMLDWGRWCECEACQQQGSHTDRNLLVVHALSEGIKAAQREGRINRRVTLLFLAYADVLEPPTKPLPGGFDYDMCIATYFPIVRCYVHEFDAPGCDVNRRYAEHLHGWAVDPQRHYRGQLCIGEYYNVSRTKCLPVVYKTTMATDIPHYHDLGARLFHYMHVTTDNWGNKSLTNYQLARQLWDQDVDAAAVVDDFLAARYGTAAATMDVFYNSLETMLENVSALRYRLAPRLDSGQRPLFVDDHLRYDERPPGAGPSLRAMLAAAERCEAALASIDRDRLPERIQGRIAEDERLFRYGERTLRLYDAMVRTYRAMDSDRMDEAQAACREALHYADLLRADTTSASLSSSHASSPNALAATLVTGGLTALQWELGLIGPEGEPPRLDADGLVIHGDEMAGGGGPRFGYGLRVFPERREVSARGNYAYAASNFPEDRLVGSFTIEGAPPTWMVLDTSGLAYPVQDGGSVPMSIRVNDTVVFEGPAPFGDRELTPLHLEVAGEALKSGLNRIEIRNETPEGPTGNRPWVGVDAVRLRPAH